MDRGLTLFTMAVDKKVPQFLKDLWLEMLLGKTILKKSYS